MTVKNRVILHSDLNNFYASCEQVKDPSLRNVPLVVSGSVEDRHGVVLAKNYLAKDCGITTGMTLTEAFRRCGNLVAVEADFQTYLAYSRKVREIYKKYTDKIEPFGIDEAWLDVTESKVFGSGREIADKIREEVKELGLTVSVGVSFNKVFAKLGSDLKKPDATTVISRENYKDVVWKLDCGDMLMVGRKTAEKLKRFNLVTIGDVARCDKNFLVASFGKIGEYLYAYANGEDDSPVTFVDERYPVKSIGNSMTAYRDLTTVDDVKIMISVLCESVADRAIEAGVTGAQTVNVSVRDEDMNWFSRQKKLPRPSVLAVDYFNAAIKLFSESYDLKKGVRSLGVSVSDLDFGKANVQLSLFDDESDYEKKVALAKTVVKIRDKYGNASVVKGYNLKDKRISRENPKKTHVIHPEGYIKKP